jgi:hypothetical protein
MLCALFAHSDKETSFKIVGNHISFQSCAMDEERDDILYVNVRTIIFKIHSFCVVVASVLNVDGGLLPVTLCFVRAFFFNFS